jgi:hypothetical protein
MVVLDDDKRNHLVVNSTAWRPSEMQFILGVIFFVLVVGLVDAGLPWPVPNGRSR